MNKNLIVIVIILTYNRAHLMERAIKSILNQKYKDYIIIIDNILTDNVDGRVHL